MKYRGIALAVSLFGLASAAFAQDPNQARNLAAACASCHGTNGHSVGGYDPLAGVPKDQLVQKMKDFKTGAKPATVMHQLAKGYSDQQIEMISAYFAAQK